MNPGKLDRAYWIDTLRRIADPVLVHLAKRELKLKMPIETNGEDRERYAGLEALGRLLCGLAPWLESGSDEGEEGRYRREYAELARHAIDAGTDPSSPDYMNFTYGGQTIVDASFLAHAILRAPTELWVKLDERVKANVIAALKATRTRKPVYSNWLLFSAMIETFLYRVGEDWDQMRVDYAIRSHENWYMGDGVYGDGPDYHADYYNSFVIQPMLVDILDTVHTLDLEWAAVRERALLRAIRYASQLERLIAPDGTYPPLGRSLAYRFGAFQHLAQMALQHRMEATVEPAQVRCALTAVIRRTIEAPNTFDAEGWLTVGFCGHQPDIGEPYVSTGSLYLCAAVFLPLGLPESDPFWQGEAAWTQVKAWSGRDFPMDKVLKLPFSK